MGDLRIMTLDLIGAGMRHVAARALKLRTAIAAPISRKTREETGVF